MPNGEPLPTLDDFLTAVETSPTPTKLVIKLKSNAKPIEVFDTNPTIMAQYIDRGCLFSSNKPITLVKAINQLEKERLRNE